MNAQPDLTLDKRLTIVTNKDATLDLLFLCREFETQNPSAVLRWAIETFGADLVVGTAFGPAGIVLLHLVSQIDPRVKIFYLETDLFFSETCALRLRLQEQLGLTIEAVLPRLSLEQQAAEYGEDLWKRDPDLCCHLRKVEPLREYLTDKRAWVTGILREQTPSRAATQFVEWNEANQVVKINPLINWTSGRLWEYIRKHDLPSNPLHPCGYPSIGCRPCTRPVRPGEDPRAGRWPGFPKTECGLHLREEK